MANNECYKCRFDGDSSHDSCWTYILTKNKEQPMSMRPAKLAECASWRVMNYGESPEKAVKMADSAKKKRLHRGK